MCDSQRAAQGKQLNKQSQLQEQMGEETRGSLSQLREEQALLARLVGGISDEMKAMHVAIERTKGAIGDTCKQLAAGQAELAKLTSAQGAQLAQQFHAALAQITKVQDEVKAGRLDMDKSQQQMAAQVKMVQDSLLSAMSKIGTAGGQHAAPIAGGGDAELKRMIEQLAKSLEGVQTKMLQAFENSTVNGFPAVYMLVPDDFDKDKHPQTRLQKCV